ncbi:MAG: hypothetical protein AAF990_14310 [Bacteroidota bacterium]
MKAKKRKLEKIALALAAVMILQAILPAYAMALTSGPAQPEFQGFQQAGTSDMVDLFTGNFKYNIPLMDVGGYPLNLAYSSDPRMDDEASWVGLGWSLNPGVISRSMRGIPDDFKGDQIEKELNMSSDRTVGITAGGSLELFGGPLKLGFSGGLVFNNKRGFEFKTSLRPGIAIGESNKQFTAGLGLSFGPSSGLDINPSIGLSNIVNENVNRQYSLGAGLNSRSGLKALTFQTSQTALYKNGEELSTGGSTNISSSFNFGPYSYTPTSLLPLHNKSIQFHATIGGAAFGSHPAFQIDGFWAEQKLAYSRESQPTYGYFHLQEAEDKDRAVMDYNSELNGQFKENAPHVPLSYGTYDIFSISGQGVGGQFRAMRNDLGIFRPAREVNTSIAADIGIEFGAGAFAHVGGNGAGTEATTTKQIWNPGDNRMKSHMDFTSADKKYENFYLRTSGEQVALPQGLFNETGGFSAVRVDNRRVGSELVAGNRFIDQTVNGAYSSQVVPQGKIQNDVRPTRNQVVSFLDVEQAKEVGLDKQIKDYTRNTIIFGDCNSNLINTLDRSMSGTFERPDHHLSEITVTQSSGSRYVYGLPVYNNQQREVSFSVDASNVLPGTNNQSSSDYALASYTPNTDNTTNNRKGKDDFFEATTTPGYAHSFLLTGILSPDYTDKTGDGITEDDSGNGIKFNYSRVHQDYKWRIPVQANRARYHEGNKSTFDDDKASYVYGGKEVWYIHSIESRTMVAQFYTSPRKDALGVLGENGGISMADSMMKLDSIKLFTKAEIKERGADASPIKAVHFEYSYKLCKKVPNHMQANAGKLTLDAVFFTFGKSRRGALNAYKFKYNETSSTTSNAYEYNIGRYDRWGFLKENPPGYPAPHEYPYVLQYPDNAYTEDFAGAWNLNEITLPSGGVLSVHYEADDYAYVQNKRAGQMMEIEGFTNGAGASPQSNLYNNDEVPYKYVAVKLPRSVASLSEAKKRYLENIKQLYFDCLVTLKNNKKERVKGYFNMHPSLPVLLENGNSRLLIPFKMLRDKRGRDIPPITFAGLQKMRLELPELFYPGFNANSAPEALIKSMVGLVNEIKNLTKGLSYNSMRKGWCKQVTVAGKASWLRLCNPDFKKLGGGTRVSKIELDDDWTIANGGGSQKYGQRYEYTTTKVIEGQEQLISSGVASFEPGIGGEENLMKEALPYEEKFLLAPKTQYYSETPVGQSLFPAPLVGYSQVKVSDIANEVIGLNRNRSGHTLHEFYTAKEFPTIVRMTAADKERIRTNPILKIFKINSKDALSVSQGYAIELNDMHGKSKRQTIYDKNNAVIKSSTYHYKVEDEEAEQKRLTNSVNVLQKNGSTTQKTIGLEVDVWQEMLEEENKTTTAGVAGNTDGFPLIFFPAFVPTFYPIFKNEKSKFRAAVTTKLIKRTGILDHVEVMENGSHATTRNVLFDSETGEVLLTRTSNEFDDNIFSFTYPAHWAYERMGQAYENIGAVFTDMDVSIGAITNAGFNASDFFKPGDELWVHPDPNTNPGKYYVTQPQTDLIIIDEAGDPLTGQDLTLQIIRSGNRNMASTPIGKVASRKDPIVSNTLNINFTTDVLAASASTFSEFWRMQCQLNNDDFGIYFDENKFNPYTSGLLGNWRLRNEYAYYVDRTPLIGSDDLATTDIHIRDNGEVIFFNPYWTYDNINERWKPNNSLNWLNTTEVTQYDWKGNQLESEDALNIPGAAYFGFQQTLPTATAQNARYEEIVFDGFEDYGFDNDCNSDFDFQRNLAFFNQRASGPDFQLVEGIAHTGRYSLQFGSRYLQYYQINISDNCLSIPVSRSADGQAEQSADRLQLDQDSEETGTQQRSSTGKEFCYTSDLGNSPPVAFENLCCACLPILTFQPGKSYLFSAWAASDSSLTCGAPYVRATANFSFGLSNPPVNLVPTGPVIDGWQRMEGRIDIPTNVTYVSLYMGGNGFGEKIYIDDVRIHPWNANMQSFAYDPFSLRLMARLDDNNYANFYEYDDEGILIRTKRETEAGILTLQEERKVFKSNN